METVALVFIGTLIAACVFTVADVIAQITTFILDLFEGREGNG